ncbi:phage baseplate assembly protein [Pandoraea sputorum]|uniref:phage baseplate assembly protein n=1 Tax=Pandoraea sputorum TaxID=93222 RepID=UPI0012423B0F|nr:contractile injection system protein, VgrG/Pvc8 family [Pandoraea sputorum]VVE06539.1 Mu P family protein [Pandoraea sputorum]
MTASSEDTLGEQQSPHVDEVRVLLTQDQIRLTGWKAARINRSIEFATSSFELTCTADAETEKLIAREGAPVQIFIGTDMVMSGYVETVEQVLTPETDQITIHGRGKLADMVDCSCRIDKINANTNLVTLAKSIAKAYSVDVVVADDATQNMLDQIPVLPRQLVSITETAWDVIERFARYNGVLAYENANGELTISTAGTAKGASGLTVGKNIEAIVCTKSTLGIFSTYNAVLSAYSAGAEDEDVTNLPVYTVVAGGPAGFTGRLRPMFFVSEQSATDRRFIEKRTNWMASRAYGRSRRVRVLTDNWRDASGALWTPNVNYPVSAPTKGVPNNTELLLAGVTFIIDKSGTHAELLFGPRQGFLPEPIALDTLPMDETT